MKLETAIIWKPVTCQRITSKRYSISTGRHLSPRYGQVILVSGYPVLRAVNWSHVDVQYVCMCPRLAKKCEIEYWLPCDADGRAGGRCTVTWLPNFLGWVDLLTHGARQARFAGQSSAKMNSRRKLLGFDLRPPLLVWFKVQTDVNGLAGNKNTLTGCRIDDNSNTARGLVKRNIKIFEFRAEDRPRIPEAFFSISGEGRQTA